MRKISAVLFFCLLLMTCTFAESPEEQEKQPVGYIALTFDDGPSGVLTERLLDGLRERNARATFFLCGYRMEQYPSALNRYLEEGHEIGVHSTVHTNLTKLSREEIHRDMKETALKIYAETGIRATIMRPPGGAYNEMVQEEAKDEGLSIILWSVDTRDWATSDAGAVLHTMSSRGTHGDVVLMHDMSKSSVEAALYLVDTMQARGYEFVTVSELAALTGTKLQPGCVYEEFYR